MAMAVAGLVTNRGKYRILQDFFRSTGAPVSFYVALVTGSVAPTADTKTMAELTEIAAGNGYTSGGTQLLRNGTYFSVGDDPDDEMGYVSLADITFTASGGTIPASGAYAQYAVLTDDNATVSAREVLAYWDLTTPRVASDGYSITLTSLRIRGLQQLANPGLTNRGTRRMLQNYFLGTGAPANLYFALLDNSSSPWSQTITMSSQSEIAAGNGYTSGGQSLARNSTDFSGLSWDDTADTATVTARDISWTANPGSLPASGNPIRYAVLTDDNAAVSLREIYAFWNLGVDITAANGQLIQFTQPQITFLLSS